MTLPIVTVDRRAKHDFMPLDVREELGMSLDKVRQGVKRRRIVGLVFAMPEPSANGWPLLQFCRCVAANLIFYPPFSC